MDGHTKTAFHTTARCEASDHGSQAYRERSVIALTKHERVNGESNLLWAWRRPLTNSPLLTQLLNSLVDVAILPPSTFPCCCKYHYGGGGATEYRYTPSSPTFPAILNLALDLDLAARIKTKIAYTSCRPASTMSRVSIGSRSIEDFDTLPGE